MAVTQALGTTARLRALPEHNVASRAVIDGAGTMLYVGALVLASVVCLLHDEWRRRCEDLPLA